MKKILFDGLAIQSKKPGMFHGGSEYAKFIFKKAVDMGFHFDVVFSKQLFTSSEIENYIQQKDIVNVILVENKSGVYHVIDYGSYDCFFSALPYIYTNYSCKTPLFGVIHGLRSIELPWDKYRYKYSSKFKGQLTGWFISHCKPIQNYLKNKHILHSRRVLGIKNAQFIVVSYHTKYSVLNYFPNLSPRDINVFYSPFEIEDKHENVEKENYYLMVSGNRYEKNVYRAVMAFDMLFSKGWLKDKKVIITGCNGLNLWKEVKNKSCFELLPYVDTDVLNSLYEHAFCFVYPSLNEGFGYPPLKAMGYGTPVIASSATSIPEACGDAACFFSPTNIDDLANRILRMDLDDKFRNDLVAKGKQRVEDLLNCQRNQTMQLIHMIFD